MSELKVIEQNGLIKIYETEKGEQVVQARELHQGLGSNTRFNDWIKRRIDECGAIENEDYISLTQKRVGNNATQIDYILKLDTAKEMAMLERNEIGKKYRKYFIEIEKKYKQSVPQIDSKFLFQLAQSLEQKEKQITSLNTENDLLAKKQLEWTTRKTIEAIVKKIGGTFGYKEAWRGFKAELLYKHGININLRYTDALLTAKNKSKVNKLDLIKSEELQAVLSTATALARNYKVDISSVVDKFKSA